MVDDDAASMSGAWGIVGFGGSKVGSHRAKATAMSIKATRGSAAPALDRGVRRQTAALCERLTDLRPGRLGRGVDPVILRRQYSYSRAIDRCDGLAVPTLAASVWRRQPSEAAPHPRRRLPRQGAGVAGVEFSWPTPSLYGAIGPGQP